MQAYRIAAAGLGAAAVALSSWVFLEAGQLPPGANAPAAPVPPQATRLPLAPTSGRGTTVTPALEGWYRNDDGTATFLIGYMNRNTTQTLEIPVGPNNHIDPGGPDYGQPTFFETGRQYGVFSVTVPKDFGTKRLTWTLVANGQQQAITLWTNQPYAIAPFVRADNGNTPPVVKFAPTGPEFTGPPRGFAQTLTTTGSEPVTLTLWATDKGNTVDQMNQFGPPVSVASPVDDPSSPANAGLADPAAAAGAGAAGGRGGGRGAGGGGGRGGAGGARGAAPAGAATDAAAGAPAAGGAGGRGGGAGAAAGGGGGRGRGGAPIRVRWVKHRGPGDVTFASATPPVVAEAMTFSKPGDYTGKATTTATFSAPGEYVLRGQLNDSSGQGGDGCCWTNVHVKVTVRAAAK